MADKRLDQENVLTDFDYALIVKGTDVAKISKADLAKVVGGLMNVASSSKNGLMSSTDVIARFASMSSMFGEYEVNNADKVTRNGIYRFNSDSGSGGQPVNGAKWGTLLVFRAHTSDICCVQILITSDERVMFRQTYTSNIASANFKEISTK